MDTHVDLSQPDYTVLHSTPRKVGKGDELPISRDQPSHPPQFLAHAGYDTGVTINRKMMMEKQERERKKGELRGEFMRGQKRAEENYKRVLRQRPAMSDLLNYRSAQDSYKSPTCIYLARNNPCREPHIRGVQAAEEIRGKEAGRPDGMSAGPAQRGLLRPSCRGSVFLTSGMTVVLVPFHFFVSSCSVREIQIGAGEFLTYK